jgi:MFS transporter, DHA1 family, inner membrane transport protein
MNPVLMVIAFAAFAAALFARMTDPMVPQIAADLAVDPHSVALLGTAFALPWALIQLVLGPVADLVGKTRVIMVCLVILTASAVIGAFATSFPILLTSRIIAGAAAGGVSPVAMAFIADLVGVEMRQVVIGRVLTASITGILIGGTVSGVLADFIGWRSIFVVAAACAALAAVAALMVLRTAEPKPARRVSIAGAIDNYRQLLANPRTKICYSAVFLEGITLFGIFPYVALLLLNRGEDRASIAGLVISGFALGGILYAISVRPLVTRFATPTLMVAGGAIAAAGLLLEAVQPAWPVQFGALCAMGFGFYLLHSCIMVQMTELAPSARGTAVAGHASAYYIGQALGPVVYGLGFTVLGAAATMVLSAIVVVAIGLLVPRLLFSSTP